MPSSRVLISSQTLGSAAATVTFSSIPATYTDLVLRISARASTGGAQYTSLRMQINSTTTNQSFTTLFSNGTAQSTRSTGYSMDGAAVGSAATANTFSNIELYFPSYSVSQNKPFSGFFVSENNSAAASDYFVGVNARLWSNTATISSFTFDIAGANLVTGSSFYLYGIKNS